VNDQDVLLSRIAERLKALADPTRLKILHVLEEGGRCVSEIVEAVGGSQANVSKHLAILRRAGLVDCQRRGLNVDYRVTDSTSLAICRTVCAVLEKQAAAEHREIKRARAASGGFA
jgi:DNA-binding transcriptional ArsR family regulator